MDLITSVQQPLLKRAINTYSITYDGATPSRIALAKQIAGKAKGRVVVTHVYAAAGQQAAMVTCHVYTEPAFAEKVERKNLLAKQQPKEAAAEAQ